MKILLSIKPKYVEKILSGKKCYEFRKAIFKNKNIKTIIIYSTSPVKKIVGEVEIEDILKDSPEKIWLKTREKSGIDKKFFNEYFKEKEIAYAIKIKNPKKYDRGVTLSEYDKNIKQAPQSFLYVN